MIFGPEVGSNLSAMSLAFQSMAADLAAIRTSLTAAPAPPQPPGRPPIWIPLSSAATGQGLTWQDSDFLRLVGFWIGGATAGRYTLQIGQGDVSRAIWIPANSTIFIYLGGDARMEIARGVAITVNSPSSGAWDAMLMAYPFDMDNP